MGALDSATLQHMTAAQIHAGLAARQFSAREVAQASFETIERLDPAIHAFLELTPEAAFQAADAVDAALASGSEAFEALGPLAGVPVAFKDNMNMTGTHTTCASRMLESYMSPYTATCVERLLQASCLPLGKLNMDEFAFGSSTETSAFGTTKNPWDTQRVPGGSSGGSAASVAAGLATITLGSDTGGSIRQPAGFCGVVGIKPTYGVVSRYGVVAFGSSLDQVGPFARSVEDAALAMNALAGRDARDCTSQDCKCDFAAEMRKGAAGMKVGIVPDFMEADGLQPEIRTRIEEVAQVLAQAGAEIVPVELPHAKAAMSAYYVLGPCEAFSNLARFDSVRYGYCSPDHKNLAGQYEASRSAGFGAEARRRIMLGSYLLSSGVYEEYYYRAMKIRTLITRDYEEAYRKVDCILAPVSPRTAFKFGEITDPTEMHLSDMFTISVNIAGNGGMNVPVGMGAQSGLPIGAQLIAPSFKDENMLRAAYSIQQHYGVAPVAVDAQGSAAKAGE